MERREDLRFLRGRGEYVDDVAMPGLLYAVILRSSVAHGRLVSIDASAALKMPGVHAVITGADMPGGPPIIPMRLQPLPEFKPFEQPVIAHDKVRYVGEPIAVVLADSVAIGEDALEAIEVEIEDLPRGRRLADRRRRTRACCSRSPAPTARWCSRRARATPTRPSPTRPTSAASIFAPARHYGLTMEPRGVMAEWDDADGKLTVSGAAKVPFFNRRILSGADRPAGRADRHDRERRRRRLRRARRILSRGFPDPVRRAPRQAAGEMDRGPPRKPDGDEPRARGGVRPRDRLRARRHHPRACAARSTPTWAPICAPTARSAPATSRSSWPGPYRVPHVKIDSSLWMTNKTPVGTYRGPGRFEADFFLRADDRHDRAPISASTASSSAART